MNQFYINGQVVLEHDLRLMFPEISFPGNISEDDASVVGASLVKPLSKPTPTFNQEVYRNGVEVTEEGVYEKWEIFDLNSQEIVNKLQVIKTKYVQQINAEDNKIYADVIGNKTTEYLKAAEDARAYKAAGYPVDDVPDYVQSWADAKLWTAQQACDDIIAQENTWLYAAKLIRDYRLKAKEAVKRATTVEEIDTAMIIWNGFVSNIRSQLGV